MRWLLTAVPALVCAVVIGALAVPMGEFVEIWTVDGQGHRYASEVWVVEVDGTEYLRSGWPDSHWLRRLRAHPVAEVERDGQIHRYRAVVVDDPAVREAVNEAMAAKYGVADRLIRYAVDMNESVPIRLEPIDDGNEPVDGGHDGLDGH